MYNQSKHPWWMAHFMKLKGTENCVIILISKAKNGYMNNSIEFETDQISPKNVNTADSIRPTAKAIAMNPTKIAHTSVARHSINHPIAYGMFTRIIESFRPSGSANRYDGTTTTTR